MVRLGWLEEGPLVDEVAAPVPAAAVAGFEAAPVPAVPLVEEVAVAAVEFDDVVAAAAADGVGVGVE